ncbi:helix-turn-helix domain-containing protein [Jannaschia sp. CCS1]|uniref:helix-turn-helix domain-containing protein n=1 Tax=Jannaschia sp. (strain CCS1) TaxID=290400 RepID=UPI000053A97E|nr:helix-turn-helix transcriptional regulator [Jannaschia sp. CCS1]ABD54472.1 transcriptional regulator, AraC family [Jannaschia sp. CCS1]
MTLDIAISSVTAGICLFCAHLLLLRRRDTGVYLPLALLFLFQGISTGVAALAGTYDPDSLGILFRISIIVGGLEITLPFLLWVYVRALTTEGQTERIPKLPYHVIPIVLVVLAFWSLLFLPDGFADTELEDDDPRLLGFVAIALAVMLADIAFKAMVATYIYLIIRRLMAYRTRLKDVFASTENRELTWIWVILICMAVYLSVSIAFTASIVSGVFAEETQETWLPTLNGIALLGLFWALGVWGLRQRPGLTRQPVVAAPEPDDPKPRKYEKSALDDERLQRIARKVEAAMAEDTLYRDPNLSLWDLAKHIGVTSHYVSQALNTHLNKSFFDLVNGWRIKDAIEQLTTTDETILTIAYDVGFNSRSAFYKAFKRETGRTPSDLRN